MTKLMLMYILLNNTIDKPIYDKITCQKMLNDRRKCEYLLDHCRTMMRPSASCAPVSAFCRKTQLDPFTKTGLNPYDIRKKCTYQSEQPSDIARYCYPDIASIENHANQQGIKTEYGVDSKAGQYRYCNAHRQQERHFDFNDKDSKYSI